MPVRIKRVYDDPEPEDGHRVLVDRLWPRGVPKGGARIDEWLKDAAPSTELRQWFHQGSREWSEFKRRYLAELRVNTKATEPLLRRLRRGQTVTLLYALRDTEQNHAQVLRSHLAGKLAR